jgi:DNA-binding NarL/FixJ family response regulator
VYLCERDQPHVAWTGPAVQKAMNALNTHHLNVMIVDDHAIFRQGLRTILGGMDDITVISEAENGRDFIDQLVTHSPDLVFMDVRMPVMNGIEATKSALRTNPGLKIVALSMFGEEEYLHKMIEAGVTGFILKTIKRPEFELALQRFRAGKAYFSTELLPFFTHKYIAREKQHAMEHQFTTRELEVLREIAKGHSSKEIAEHLFISKRTVEGHKANLIAKTGSQNVLKLLIYAVHQGLVKI